MEGVRKAVSWLCGWVAGLWYALPAAFHVLLGVMLVDILLGLFRAVLACRLDSETMRKGFVKKATILCLTGLAYVIEHEIGRGTHLGSATALGFCAVEGLSILEHSAALGVPLPEPLRSWLCNPAKEQRYTEVRHNEPSEG